MPYFVAFGPASPPANAGFSGVGNTPYDRLDDAIEAAKQGKQAAAERGINQHYSVVEAPTSQDAVLFAANATPPRDVLQRMFDDPDHVISGRIVWTEDDTP
jgi:hypothetical protein